MIYSFAVIGLVVAIATPGCHHPKRSLLDPCESRVGVDCAWLHDSPCVTASIDHIPVSVSDLTPPRTPQKPEATEILELGLADAISIALRNSDVIRTLIGPSVVSSGPSTIYDPAIAETQIQTALAAFDANWNTRVFWTRTDQAPGTTFGGGIPVPNQRDQASFSSTLSKLLATGATAGIAFNTNYFFRPPSISAIRHPGPDGIFGTADDPPPTIFTVHTPAQYTPNVEFTLRQPLLQNAGTDFNRAQIVIARLKSDQSLWDLKQTVLQQVRSVEEAYWDLYAAHGVLRTLEELIPELVELVRIRTEEVKADKVTLDLLAEAQTRLAEFRQQRTQAMNAVLERESILRYLLGMPSSDGSRLVPMDKPVQVPISVDWPATVATTLDNRPEIVRRRLEVRIRELELLKAYNYLKPQLDVEGLWRISGLDHELDDAIGVLTDNKFTDWQLGVTLSVPVGYRQASAGVQAAELQLRKDRAVLNNTVHLIAHQLSDLVRDLDSLYIELRVAEERVNYSRLWVEIARTKATPELATGVLPDQQNLYIQALQAYRNAAVEVSRILAQYNTTLAKLEEAKGTLLKTNNIELAEDPTENVRFCRPCLPVTELPPIGSER